MQWIKLFAQDITVTLISERAATKVVLEEDTDDISSVNTQSFVDEQEWKLYNNVETIKGTVDKVMEGAKAMHPSLSFRCHASRRFGFFVWNIFFVMVIIITDILKLWYIYHIYFTIIIYNEI